MKIENLAVSGFDSAMLTVKNKGYVYKNPCRHSNGLMILRNGKVRYFQSGKTYLSDPHHVLLIPAGADYSLVCDEDSETCVINFLSPAISEEILSFECSEDFSLDAEFVISNYDGNTAARLSSVSRLYAILSRLLSGEKDKIPKIIKRGVDFIDENVFDNALTIENAARCAGVSEVYFRRVFGECFGVSPLKYIQEKRISHAKRLMSDRTVKLESIALDSGYTSIYSFSAAFKKKEGISPSQYREKYGEL